jgi:hypothetical protein
VTETPMSDRIVLQKLLSAPIAVELVEHGLDQVGGYVTAASAAAGLRTPTELLAAHGVDGAPQFADVVRFEQPRLTILEVPGSADRPWPTFPNGFLLGDSLARVWNMSRTRYSFGAEYWRIRSDGQQKCLSNYAGVARGWVGAREWRPPSSLVGTMARWHGGEYFADVRNDTVLLTLMTADTPAGFEQIRHGVWSATVQLSECEVFERVLTAEVDGVPVRLLRRAGGQAEALLLTDEPTAAKRLGARLVEPGGYEVVVEVTRLVNLRGVENQLAATA